MLSPPPFFLVRHAHAFSVSFAIAAAHFFFPLRKWFLSKSLFLIQVRFLSPALRQHICVTVDVVQRQHTCAIEHSFTYQSRRQRTSEIKTEAHDDDDDDYDSNNDSILLFEWIQDTHAQTNNQYSIWRSVEEQSHISLLNYFSTIWTVDRWFAEQPQHPNNAHILEEFAVSSHESWRMKSSDFSFKSVCVCIKRFTIEFGIHRLDPIYRRFKHTGVTCRNTAQSSIQILHVQVPAQRVSQFKFLFHTKTESLFPTHKTININHV